MLQYAARKFSDWWSLDIIDALARADSGYPSTENAMHHIIPDSTNMYVRDVRFGIWDTQAKDPN